MARMTYSQYEAALDSIMDDADVYSDLGTYQAHRGGLNARHAALLEAATAAGVVHPRTPARPTGGKMQLTIAQRRARATAILAESERSGRGIMEAIKTVNGRMIAEAAQSRASRAAGVVKPKAAGKAARRAARDAVVAEAVRESLAQARAARAAAPPAKPARPVAEQLAELSNDGLASVAVAIRESGDSPSPFWRPADPQAQPVTESADPAPPAPPRPLHEMSDAELAEYAEPVWTAFGQASGYQSSSWAR